MDSRFLLALACLALAACTSAPQRIDPFTMKRAQFESDFASRFYPPGPKPAPQELADPAAGQVADAKFLQPFADFDRAYSESARAEAKRELARLLEDAASLTHEQFLLRVAHITALADNGHTTINENSFKKNTPRLPLRTFWFADGLYILRASHEQGDLLGARIDGIDGRPVESVFGVMRQYMGGTEIHRRIRLLAMLESPAILQAAGVAREPHALTLSGALADGKPFERRIEAEDRDRSAPVSSTMRVLFPVRTPNLEKLESFLGPDESLPVWLRDPGHLFSTAALEGGGLYVALGSNTDDEGRIADFLATLLARIVTEKPKFVVLDFRMNGGGDYTKTLPFMGALLEVTRPATKVYVLTSGWTFSAAITSVSALRTFGEGRVILVGEPVGDGLDFWAEGGGFTLPNSAISVFYTTGRHVYNGRCVDPNCFYLNELYPVHVDNLDPDIPAPLTFAAYRARRDPAMEAVLAARTQRSSSF